MNFSIKARVAICCFLTIIFFFLYSGILDYNPEKLQICVIFVKVLNVNSESNHYKCYLLNAMEYQLLFC